MRHPAAISGLVLVGVVAVVAAVVLVLPFLDQVVVRVKVVVAGDAAVVLRLVVLGERHFEALARARDLDADHTPV